MARGEAGVGVGVGGAGTATSTTTGTGTAVAGGALVAGGPVVVDVADGSVSGSVADGSEAARSAPTVASSRSVAVRLPPGWNVTVDSGVPSWSSTTTMYGEVSSVEPGATVGGVTGSLSAAAVRLATPIAAMTPSTAVVEAPAARILDAAAGERRRAVPARVGCRSVAGGSADGRGSGPGTGLSGIGDVGVVVVLARRSVRLA